MIIPSLILYLTLLLYFVLLVAILSGFKKPTSELGDNFLFTKFSILIPVRNEFNHIEKCIQSVLDNEYPVGHFEIIVVNDHSEDGTLEVLRKFNAKIVLLHASGVGKKHAIEQGVLQSRFDNVITLDADCTVDKHWLQAWSYHIANENPTISTGMVQINNNHSVIANYEALDIMNLMAVTSFGIHKNLFVLGNGANLFFKKNFYLRSKTNEQYASGDDVFLLNKAKTDGQIITYNHNLKSAVSTESQASFKDLLLQRRRWSTKTRGYASIGLISIQSLIFFITLAVPVLIILNLLHYNYTLFLTTCLFILIKFLVELLYLSYLSHVNKRRLINQYFVSSFILNTFIYLYMSYHALFPGEYKWKNRTVK